jgi:hypothetical protein
MDELLQWCRQERATMLDSIRRMEAKELRLGRQLPSGLVDETQEWIGTLKGRVAELDDLLAVYEKPK